MSSLFTITDMIDLLLFLTAMIGRLSVLSRGDSVSSDTTLNGTYDNVTHMINSMLKSYDIRLRPNFGVLHPATVSAQSKVLARKWFFSKGFSLLHKALILDLEIAIASFDSVSEVNMDFTLTLYLYQYWRDERLAWSPNRTKESITLSGDFSKRIWVPDTFLANDKSSYLHDVTETNKMMKLHSDGFSSTLACKMDLRSFPLDRQNFSVEIESYGYTTSDLLMRWRNGRKSVRGVMESEIAQFRIIDYEALDRIENTSTGSYQRLSLVLILRRNVGYYVFQTYLPSSLIVALSWISFWINHEATAARVALGVTTVLTMTTISTGVRSTLPRISYIKAIDVYLVMCFVFVFAALLEYAAVNYTYWGSSRVNKGGGRRRPSDPLYGQERKLINVGSTEFPTWEMYSQTRAEHYTKPRVRRPLGRNVEKSPVEDRRRRSGYEEEEEDDVLITDTGVTIGSCSPLPQLRRQPAPTEQGTSETNWTSMMSSQVELASRSSSPPVALHTSGSNVRRRQQSALTAVSSYDQQLLDYNLGDASSQKSRRRAHSSQSQASRRSVSFSAWRGRTAVATSLSNTSSRLLHSRQLSRRELVNSLREKAKAVRAALPRISDVNVIDKWSRAMFPFSFVLFNFIYWCYYVFSDWND